VRVPGLKTLKLSARWLRSRLVGGTLIVGYHNIAEPLRDAGPLSVTPQHFAEQLEVLSQVGRVVSLQELVGGLREGCVPKRAVVLTFDDGYADLLCHAKPLLERYHAPATVFVTTGFLGHEFWWDKAERMLPSSSTLPRQLSLQIRDSTYRWVPSDPDRRRVPDPGSHLVQSVNRSLLALPAMERERALAELRTWSDTTPGDLASRRALTEKELAELATGELIDIGAHTVTHPVLASLPPGEQRAEIRESKVRLERILGRPVTSFSYPNGSMTQETRTIVQDCGFSCACASHNGVAWRGSDLFRLPRFWVPDWDGEAFSRWLRMWLAR
jgi:peptidoglycan/xylan/chitin deacetylase (PgdA/CDA1 family)